MAETASVKVHETVVLRGGKWPIKYISCLHFHALVYSPALEIQYSIPQINYLSATFQPPKTTARYAVLRTVVKFPCPSVA